MAGAAPSWTTSAALILSLPAAWHAAPLKVAAAARTVADKLRMRIRRVKI